MKVYINEFLLEFVACWMDLDEIRHWCKDSLERLLVFLFIFYCARSESRTKASIINNNTLFTTYLYFLVLPDDTSGCFIFYRLLLYRRRCESEPFPCDCNSTWKDVTNKATCKNINWICIGFLIWQTAIVMKDCFTGARQ